MSTKVIHVVPALGIEGSIGGAARVVVDLTRYLAQHTDYDVQLCVLSEEDTNHGDYQLATPPVFLGHSGKYRSLPDAVSCAKQLRALITKHGADIVHSHLWQADHVSAMALKSLGVHHLVHIHDTRPWISAPGLKNATRRHLYRSLLKRSRATFIACSEAAKRYACEHLGLQTDNVRVVLNAIDSSWLSPEPNQGSATLNNPAVVGCSALLQPGKGHEYLLQAMATIHEKDVAFQLRVAGGGSRLGEYEKMAVDLGIGDQTEFKGRVADMRAFYDELDVFVLPSLSEGLPLSVLEAMARGKPVVATAIAGIPEAVTDEEEGYLVPPADPNALSTAIEKLVQDEDLRSQMGQRGHERVQRQFVFDRAGKQVADIYEELTHA